MGDRDKIHPYRLVYNGEAIYVSVIGLRLSHMPVHFWSFRVIRPVVTEKPVGETNHMRQARMKRVAILGSVAAVIAAISMPANAQFRPSLQESRATADEAKASQTRINQIDDETASLLNEFRADTRQLDASLRYNRTVVSTIEKQARQIARIQEDISNVSGLQQAVDPLMEDMVAAFEKFVDADMPFNLDGPTGRLRRVQRVRETLEDPNKPAAEKYRTIIEGYQLENEFGRTVNHYTGTIDVDGVDVAGDFLQVGRVALIFKNTDETVLKSWNNETREWEDIASSFAGDITIAMRIAKKQAAVNLFALPLKRQAASQ